MTAFLVWLLLAGPLWALVGSASLPRRYRRHGLDPRFSGRAAGLWGAVLGVPALAWLWWRRPRLRRGLSGWVPGALLAMELVGAYALLYPGNPLLTHPGYLLDQVQNGLVVGAVFGTMAVGLTLIFSVQGVINFAHGQLVMLGGVMGYLLLTTWLPVNALVAIPLVGLACLLLGLALEPALLAPLHRGEVERPDEYAILITFGFGLFLQYALVGVLGNPTGIRAPRYTDRPWFGIDAPTFRLGPMLVRTDMLIAGVVGLLLFVGLTLFLRYTWTGKSLRAVAQNRLAATVTGIDSGRAFTLAFGIGVALAGMAGAALVPVLNFPVPEIATRAALRSYVIIVLGGLGSVPGAFLGGLFLGVAEALTVAGFPDPSKGAIYQIAAGLVIFAVMLLVRPQGFLGRKT